MILFSIAGTFSNLAMRKKEHFMARKEVFQIQHGCLDSTLYLGHWSAWERLCTTMYFLFMYFIISIKILVVVCHGVRQRLLQRNTEMKNHCWGLFGLVGNEGWDGFSELLPLLPELRVVWALLVVISEVTATVEVGLGADAGDDSRLLKSLAALPLFSPKFNWDLAPGYNERPFRPSALPNMRE